MEEQPTIQMTAATPVPAAKPARWVWPAAVVLGIAAYFGLVALHMAFTRESTDDAFIAADIVSIAPKVAGHIADVLVKDNQPIKKGDVLAEIDARDYQMKLAQRQASAATSEADLKVGLSLLELMSAKNTTAAGSPTSMAHAQEDAPRAAADQRGHDARPRPPIAHERHHLAAGI